VVQVRKVDAIHRTEGQPYAGGPFETRHRNLLRTDDHAEAKAEKRFRAGGAIETPSYLK